MREMNIQYTQSYSDRKGAYVERFNRTIQDLIAREREGVGASPKQWITLYKRALYKYNFVNIHSFTKLTPNQGRQDEYQTAVASKFHIKHSRVKPLHPRYKVGDIVRIYRIKGKFGRSYHQDYSDELFKIIKILVNMPHPRYRIQDMSGEIIKGDFMEDLLSKYIP